MTKKTCPACELGIPRKTYIPGKNMNKKWKVKFAEGALDNLPEEDREKIAKELKDMFATGDPSTMGAPLEELPPGKMECPHCDSALIPGPVMKIPTNDGAIPAQVFDCEKCDKGFIGDPIN